MPVFDRHFYQDGGLSHPDVDSYRTALRSALDRCTSSAERDRLLRQEAVEITRHVTDGIRDLVKHDKRVKHLVLDLGAIPLATWAESLDTLAENSLPMLRMKIAEMRRDLEHGRIEGFPGTMVLHGKPTFATFESFYGAVFEQERT